MQSNIDHLAITVPQDKFDSMIEWYKKALTPLSYKEMMRVPGAVGLGNTGPDFWISAKDNCPRQELHFAFAAPDHATVDAFHQAAIAAGGTCNGAPGLRPQYHKDYYGAFVIDPMGNNVEMVNHGPCADASTST